MKGSGERNKEGMPILGGVIILLIGIGLLVGGLFMRNDRQKKMECYVKTTGMVVDEDYDDGTSTPIYGFKVNGEIYEVRDSVATAERGRVGSRVTIYYNPDNPADAFADTNANSHNLLFLLGGFFSLLALGVILNSLNTSNTIVKENFPAFLFGAIFVGFPAACFYMLPGLGFVIKFLLGVLMLAGVFGIVCAVLGIIMGERFTSVMAARAKKTEEYIESFNDNEKVRKAIGVINNGERVARIVRTVISLVMLAAFLVFAISMFMKNKSLRDENGMIYITDKLIAKELGCKQSELPEYIVVKRIVTEVKGNKVYFEEAAGLKHYVQSEYEYKAGDGVYWVELFGYAPPILCPESRFTYNGDKTMANSERYDRDGRCFLNDEFVKGYAGFDGKYSVLEVQYIGVHDKGVVFDDSEGYPHVLNVISEEKEYYGTKTAGTPYYWVRCDDTAFVVEADYYVYK